MPRLSPLHWFLLAIFLAFYGFTVFALTRDYYLRHPPRATAATTASPHTMPRQEGSSLGMTSVIPQSITETNPDLLRQQAETLFVERRFAEAVPVYRRILELDPDGAEVYNDLGLALHYAGDTTGALEVLRTGTRKGPELQRLWLTLGFVNLQGGDVGEARAALERARDLDARNEIGQEAAQLLGRLPGPTAGAPGQP